MFTTFALHIHHLGAAALNVAVVDHGLLLARSGRDEGIGDGGAPRALRELARRARLAGLEHVAVLGLVGTELARSAIGVRGSLDAVLAPRLERNEAVALAARGAFLQGEPRS